MRAFAQMQTSFSMKKKVATKKSTKKQSFFGIFKTWAKRLKQRRDLFLKRRPHRSFKRTLRRDYARSLKLPGYWAFTIEVGAYLWRHKKIFFLLIVLYALITALFVGLASQANYADFGSRIKDVGGQFFSGKWWEVGQAGMLLAAGITGSLSDSPSDLERCIAVIVGLLMWLTTVWLLRALLAGKKPRLRDGLYQAGAPIVGTFCVLAVLLLQLVPLALAALAFSAASSTGFLDQGIEAMIFWSVEILLIMLALYWFASTFFALVIVTLPGMYPLQALKNAGDIVVGRRLRIFLRFVWLLVLMFVVWVVVLIPIILLDGWLKSIWPAISWVPVVPIFFLVMASLSVLWFASYTYMLYRKVVDDDAAPA